MCAWGAWEFCGRRTFGHPSLHSLRCGDYFCRYFENRLLYSTGHFWFLRSFDKMDPPPAPADPLAQFDFEEDLKDILSRNKLHRFASAFDELGFDSPDSLQRFTSIQAVSERFAPKLKPGQCDRLFVCIWILQWMMSYTIYSMFVLYVQYYLISIFPHVFQCQCTYKFERSAKYITMRPVPWLLFPISGPTGSLILTDLTLTLFDERDDRFPDRMRLASMRLTSMRLASPRGEPSMVIGQWR